MAFCEVCHDVMEYEVRSVLKTKQIKGKSITYDGRSAICSECNNEIHVAEIRDHNLHELDRSYRESENLIKVSDIGAILERYKIAKRPLSLLLGWGELTITRYLDGDIPTKQYSDSLKRLRDDYIFYEKMLDEGKCRITEHAYKKSKAAVEDLKSKGRGGGSNEGKITSVVHYLLAKCEDITPLALQKLLYYAQSFHKVFHDEFLFTNDCEAWVHGPVYRVVYEKYREYSYNPIEKPPTFGDNEIEQTESELLDAIIVNFGCYSGRILEKMSHIEKPWRMTRKGLQDHEVFDGVISKDLINEYFTDIKHKYQMLNVSDIKDYSTDLFIKVNT